MRANVFLSFYKKKETLFKKKVLNRCKKSINKSLFRRKEIIQHALGKTFEDYRVDDNNALAVKAAKKLIELPTQGAYFYGEVGTGKTYLAALIAQEVLKRGRAVIFCTVPSLSMQIRSTFKGNAETTEADLMEQLIKVPTLILDDIGMEKPTRFVCSTLCNLFNERYNARRQTILTSNYRLKELETIFNHPSDGAESYDGTRIYLTARLIIMTLQRFGQ